MIPKLDPDRAKSSAKESVKQLAEEHFDYLYRYAARYFNSAETVEDLIQETFLVAVQKIDSFEGRSSARTWLTGILKNKIMDQIGRIKSNRTDAVGDISEDRFSGLFDAVEHWADDVGPVSWGASADKLLRQQDFLKVVQGCLSKLPERARQIFLLTEVEEEDRQELCNRFQLTTTNIGVILYRARMSLQQCVQLNWGREGKQ